MALDEDTVDKFTKFINEKWKNKNCIRCDSNSWVFHGYVVLHVSDLPIVNAIPNQGLPSVAMVCTVCGTTEIVNAIVAGVAQK